MSEEELTRIEAAIGLPLPPAYREFLDRHAAEVARIREELPGRSTLRARADKIITENRPDRRVVHV